MMRRTMMTVAVVAALALVALPIVGCGAGEGDETAAESTEATPEEAANDHGDEVAAVEPEEFEESPEWQALETDGKKGKLNAMADEALEEVFNTQEKSAELYNRAYGWAAFDNLKLAIGISGGGGAGVAVVKDTNERTFMKMGTGGIGVGLGGKKYQVVFLFQDQKTFETFVNKGWQADAQAGAAAGKNTAETMTNFVNGMAIYQIGDKGLMASADIAGTKYWKNKKLND